MPWRIRILSAFLGVLGLVFLLAGLLWFAYPIYLDRVVASRPSTKPIVRTGEGEFVLGTYSGGDQILAGQIDSAQPDLNTASSITTWPSPVPMPAKPSIRVLPPTRLIIPKIAVSAPIVLADNDNLPQFKGVGWYIGTGFPGFRGNMVLFGHLNGEYETFSRLNELKVGDQFSVEAMERTIQYKVTETKVVSKDDLSVMLPAADSRATLITCTGDFIPPTRDYTHRLIVIGSTVGPALGQAGE